jgi:serine/threonine-protein kinase
MSLPERSTLGRYRIERKLGAGAMGEVFLASDPHIDRQLAIKTVLLGGIGALEVEERKVRLMREAKAAGKLVHPHVVTLFDAGDADGVFYLAFEYVAGPDLAARQRMSPPLTLGEVLRIGRQAAEGLDAAHRQGIVHRDIKPSNILLDGAGQVKISDFGIAKMLGQATELTQTGSVVGSPHYLSPEQIRGEELDGRSDLFSLGVVLYELLTRHKPFEGETITTLVYQILAREPLPVGGLRAGLPDRVGAVVARLLAKERDQRFGSARELADELAACERELPRALLDGPAVVVPHEDEPTARLESTPTPTPAAVDATSPTRLTTAPGSRLPPPPPPPLPPPGAGPGAAAVTAAPAARAAPPAPAARAGRRGFPWGVAVALGVLLLLVAGGAGGLLLWLRAKGVGPFAARDEVAAAGTGEQEAPAGLLPDGSQPAAQDPASRTAPDPAAASAAPIPGSWPGAAPAPRETVPRETMPRETVPRPDAAQGSTGGEGSAASSSASREPAGSTASDRPAPPSTRVEPRPTSGAPRGSDAVAPGTARRPAESRESAPVPTRPRVAEPEPRQAAPPQETAPARVEPAQAPAERFDEQLATGLALKFRVQPEDTFLSIKQEGDARFTSVGRAVDYSADKKRAPAYDLPGPGVYYLRLYHEGNEKIYRLEATQGGAQGVITANFGGTPPRRRRN